MLTIKYKTYNGQVETWKDELEALVIGHKLIEDKTIETPVLTTKSETIIGITAISKYVESLVEYQQVWFNCACK